MGINWKLLKRRLGIKDASGREASATAFEDFEDEEASDWIDEDELPDPEFFTPKRNVYLAWRPPLHLRTDELPDPEWGNPWCVPIAKRAVLLSEHYLTTGVITSLLIALSPALIYFLSRVLSLVPLCDEKISKPDMLLFFSGIFFFISVFAHKAINTTEETWRLMCDPSPRTLVSELVRESRSVLIYMLPFLASTCILGLLSSTTTCRRWYLFAVLAMVYLLSLVGQACRYLLLKGFTRIYSRKGENLLLKVLHRMSSAYDFIGNTVFSLFFLVPFIVIYLLITLSRAFKRSTVSSG